MNNKNPYAILRYSGMAFQLIVSLLIGYFIGNKLDEKFETHTPYFTAFSILAFLFIGMYISLKDVFYSKK